MDVLRSFVPIDDHRKVESTNAFVSASSGGNVRLMLIMLDNGQQIGALDHLGLNAMHWGK